MKKIKGDSFKIDRTALLLNSAGKENKSMDCVRSGTGVHKNKKAYTRKDKHKKNYC